MLRDIVADDMRAAEVIKRLRGLLTRGEISRQPIDSIKSSAMYSSCAGRHRGPAGQCDAGARSLIYRMRSVISYSCSRSSSTSSSTLARPCRPATPKHRKLTVSTYFDPPVCEIACTVRTMAAA